VKLDVSQIKQIAGRAGRYRTANQDQKEGSTETKLIDSQDSRLTSFKGSVKQSNVGLVTCLDEKDLYDIQTALNTEADPIKAAALQPPVEYIDAFAQSLPSGTPFEYLLQRMSERALMHPRFFMGSTRDLRATASHIDQVKGLNIVQNCMIAAAPVDTRTEIGKKVVKALAQCIANRTAVTIVDVPEIPLDVLDRPMSGDREYLLNLELLHKSLILYLWLSYRFTNILLDREMAVHAKEMVEEKINATLLQFSANPKLRNKLLMMRQAEGAKDAANESRDGSHHGGSAVSALGTMEEDLTESLHDLSALPINWENRPADEVLSTDDAKSDNLQTAAAQS
jgi:ATP-dependent RNA helicase SUPV3L1/SUV3